MKKVKQSADEKEDGVQQPDQPRSRQQPTDPKYSGEAMTIPSLHRMGDKVAREKAPLSSVSKDRAVVEEDSSEAKDPLERFGTESNVYQPMTKESKAVYDQILDIVYRKFPDQSHHLIIDVANEIIAALKLPSVPENERKSQISAIMPINDDLYYKLKALVQEIRDFVFHEQEVKKPESDIINVFIDEESTQEQKQTKIVEETVPSSFYAATLEEETERLDEEIDRESFETFDDKYLINLISAEIPIEFQAKEIEQKILEILNTDNEIEIQNELIELSGDLDMNTIRTIYDNRRKIFYGYLLAVSKGNAEKLQSVIKEIKTNGQLYNELSFILREYDTFDFQKQSLFKPNELNNLQNKVNQLKGIIEISLDQINQLPKRVVALKNPANEFISFNQKSIKLPKGSTKVTEKGYEEIIVPPTIPQKTESKHHVHLEDLPSWSHSVFPDIKKFNIIQSTVFPYIFNNNGNVLVCAPTGAGKTVVAIFSILSLIKNYIDNETGLIDLSAFKVVYLAPMKALVSEVVSTLNFRLQNLGIKAMEFTGDIHLTFEEYESANVIVSTPEKWDVLTRKASERHFMDKLKLLIIDEVHLLGDVRGPVLEAVAIRAINQKSVRIVALSATLPNYEDVATFLNVDRAKGMFYFGNNYRPVPLSQVLVGISENRGVKKMLLVKEILFKKIIERIKQHQILIFVHSRKETARTAEEIKEMAFAEDIQEVFISENSKQIIEGIKGQVMNGELRELLSSGLAFHNAGLSRNDRKLVEDLFASGHISVLVSTATLAWGVNLPAHTVIIKNTQVYSPSLGRWTPLSIQDLFQMLGRAGRPLYDKDGEGIIITSAAEVKHYVSLLNEQLPIESQMIPAVSELLNAEIVTGNIQDLHEALNWLQSSYFGIRLAKNPRFYGLNCSQEELTSKRILYMVDILHTAAIELEQAGLIRYDRARGIFESTLEGRVASYFYIRPENMKTYAAGISGDLNIIDLFRLFTTSSEFKNIIVREEEKIELAKLHSQVPIPIKGPSDDPKSKVNVLLQCFISRIELEGYALNSDLKFVSQNAQRIFRALFEISLLKNSATSMLILDVCKMVELRIWNTLSPLRQYVKVSEKIFRRIEQQEHLTWDHFRSMTIPQLNSVLRSEQTAENVYMMLKKFPHLEIKLYAQTISRGLIRVELAYSPIFEWNDTLHGRSMIFHLFVTDVDNENVLYHQPFMIKKDEFLNTSEKTKMLSFHVQLLEPLQPHYFIRIMSDKWIAAENHLPLSFKNLVLPAKFPLCREVEDIEPLESDNCEFLGKFGRLLGIKSLSQAQSQIYDTIYNTFDNVLIGAIGNFGKFTMALAGVARLYQESKTAKTLILFPSTEALNQKLDSISKIADALGVTAGVVPDNLQKGLSILSSSQIIIATAQNFDKLSRNYKKRPQLKQIRLVVATYLSEMGSNCPELEVVISRIKLVFSWFEQKYRLIVLTYPIANFSSVCEWLEIEPQNAFNFHPSVRNAELNVMLNGVDALDSNNFIQSTSRRLLSIAKLNRSNLNGLLIFVDSKESARLLLTQVLKGLLQSNRPLLTDAEEKSILVQAAESMIDLYNASFLENGAAYIHSGTDSSEVEAIVQLFKLSSIKLLVVTKKAFNTVRELNPNIISIVETDGFALSELQYLMGLVNQFSHEDKPVINAEIFLENNSEISSVSNHQAKNLLGVVPKKCLIFTQEWRKSELRRKLFEPIVLESVLAYNLIDYINVEIVSGTIENHQNCIDWITWTFFYRRIAANPNFYNIASSNASDISDYISELIEAAFGDLVAANCAEIEDNTITASNGGIIASFYGVKVYSISILLETVKDSLTLKGLLESLAYLSEFSKFEPSEFEVQQLKNLYEIVPLKLASSDFHSSQFMVYVLLQAYFIRADVPSDLMDSVKEILEIALNLIQAFIDCCSSIFLLKPTFIAMKLSKLIVQRMWTTDNTLRQLPFFDDERISMAQENGVQSLDDFFEIEDDVRNKLFTGLSEKQIMEIAKFSNRFPNITANATIEGERVFTESEAITLSLDMIREGMEEGQDLEPVFGNGLIHNKEESWWILVADKNQNKLFVVKKVTFNDKYNKPITFSITVAGKFDLAVILVCDSYIGFDLELPAISVEIRPDEEELNGDDN